MHVLGKVSALFVIIIILVIFISITKQTTWNSQESYISYVYTPTLFELHPPDLYVSFPEKKSDMMIANLIKNKFPLKITHDKNKAFKTNLAILPDGYMLMHNHTKYRYMFPFHTMAFTVLVNIEVKGGTHTEMNNIRSLNGKNIGLFPQGGYVEALWKKLLSVFNFTNKPHIKKYTHENHLLKDFSNGSIDAILTLVRHPDTFVQRVSLKYRIKIITWTDTDVSNKVSNQAIQYFLPGVRSTTVSLREYRLYDLRKVVNGYGYNMSLFALDTFHTNAAESMMEHFMMRDGLIRQWAVGGSPYFSYHPGARAFLEKKGFISVRSQNENPACLLRVGKGLCRGKTEEIADVMYQRTNWNTENSPNPDEDDLSVLPFLTNTNKQLLRIQKKEKEKGVKFLFNGQSIVDDLKKTAALAWQCFGETKYQNKQECESSVNLKGEPRTPGVWDKPCLKHEECPFYKKNKNYPNERGKCIRGFCEMPLNVERIAFRKFSNKTKPLCHGCSFEEHTTGKCCKKVGNMASPDYAFPDDRNERLTHQDELDMRDILI